MKDSKPANSILQPLKYRNYRLFMLSLALWLTAAWIANLSFGLIAKEIYGNSPFYVGMVGFGFNFPALIFIMFGGVLADRYNRHKLMFVIMAFFLIPCVIMAVMLTFGRINYWVMIVMVFLFGTALSFGNPTMNALIPNCIDDERDIGQGVSLFNAMARTLQFLGNALGGILYALIGSCLLFWTNTGLVIMAILLLIGIKLKPIASQPVEHRVWQDLKEGLDAVFGYFPFAMIILLAGFAGFCAWPYIFQLPIVNAYNLHGTPMTLGLLLAIGGLGGAIGAFLLTFSKQVLYLSRYMFSSIIVISVSLIGLSFCRNVIAAALVIFFLDLGMSCLFVVSSVFIQQIVADEKRGRVMSTLVLFNFGLIPISSLAFFGGLGQWFGAMRMFRVAGLIGLVIFIIFMLCLKRFRMHAKPKFVAAGLLPANARLVKI